MGEDKSQCPNCSEPIEAGQTLCPNCGVNLVSGESFDEKVKRARGREKKVSEGVPALGIGLAVLFGLLLLAGFLYQGRVIKVLRNDPELWTDHIGRLQEVEFLVDQALEADSPSRAADLGERAREKSQELINELREEAESIEIESAPTTRQKREGKKAPKALRQAKRTLLYNLAAKAEYHESRLPNRR